MANTVVYKSSIQYTPPAAPTNSGIASFILQASYSAQQVGNISVVSGTAPAEEYSIDFGSVTVVKMLAIRNLTSADINIEINGVVTSLISMPPRAEIIYMTPIAATTGTHPIVSAKAIILVAATADESIQTWVMGD